MFHRFGRFFRGCSLGERLAGSLIFVGLLSLCGCEKGATGNVSAEPAPQAAPEVTVTVVKAEAVPLIRELPGRTAAFNVAQVRPQVNGIILKRKFEEGAMVREGDSLYEIDSSVYRANYDKAAADLKSRESSQNRIEQLQRNKAMSVQDYEDAHYAYEKAKADLELARLDLDYCDVRAPLTGKIGLSNITVGALVTNGQPQEMAVIQQLDPIYVDLKPAVPQILGTRKASAESAAFAGGTGASESVSSEGAAKSGESAGTADSAESVRAAAFAAVSVEAVGTTGASESVPSEESAESAGNE